jgi:hypothetical protein
MRLVVLALVLAALVGPAAASSERVREQRTVKVARAAEVWRLVWTGPTRQACGVKDEDVSLTCPCSGFAYGEAGALALVRLKSGHEVERMKLAPLFENSFDHPARPGEAALPLRSGELSDMTRFLDHDPRLRAEIARRPITPIMRFADYDHDGHATEFLMQVGTLPCGKRQYVALGVSADNPHLHALGSVAHPGKPLVLPAQAWAALAAHAQPGPVLTWQCGDHGSERRSDVVLSTANGRIRVLARSFSCPEDGSRERLVESAQW